MQWLRPTRPLPWNALQSDDLPSYVFNLRAAGFPEAIVRRIIVAELDRRLAAEKRPAPVNTNYWRTGPQQDEAERARREARRALMAERWARIKELLGDHEASPPGLDKSFWMMLHLTGVRGDVGSEKMDRLNSLVPKILSGVRISSFSHVVQNLYSFEPSPGERQAIIHPRPLFGERRLVDQRVG